MKTASAAPFFVLLALPVAAPAIGTGDTAAMVRSELGAPRGQVRAGDRQLWYYDRGEVELRAGVVTRAALLSEAEVAVRDARLAAVAERLRQEREARVAEGSALKERKLADANFRSAPASYQLAFWENFARRYPEVPCADELAIARARWDELVVAERARTLESERLAELEARVAAAEDQPERVVYRFRSYGGYGRHYQSPTLWPVEYHFWNAPLPVISVPVQPLLPGLTSPRHPAPSVRPAPSACPSPTSGTDEGREDSRHHRRGGRDRF